MRGRNGDADFLVRRGSSGLDVAEGLPGHGEHVRSRLAPALDQLDQQKERADGRASS